MTEVQPYKTEIESIYRKIDNVLVLGNFFLNIVISLGWHSGRKGFWGLEINVSGGQYVS